PCFGDPFVRTGMVGIYCLGGNRPEILEIMFASKRAGVPYTPFSKYLDPEIMVRDIVYSDYRVLFVDRKGLEAIGSEWGGLYLRSIPVVLIDDEEIQGTLSYGTVMRESRRPIVPTAYRNDALDLEAVLFTSGTTGRPKKIERLVSSLRVHPLFGIAQADR